MAEFIRAEEKVVNVSEPVIFENNTDSDFSVNAAIVFRKSGLYDVSIVGRRTIISKVAERPKGHWIFDFAHNEMTCSECGRTFTGGFDLENADNFCRHCGSDNRGEQDE